MKKLLFCPLYFLFGFHAFGQGNYEIFYTDSLLNQAENANSDSAKIIFYFQLSDFWSERDTSKAFSYLKVAKQHFPKHNEYFQGLFHFYNAGIYFDREINKGMEEYMAAEKYLKRIHSKTSYTYRSKLWNNYGALLQRLDREEEYIEILLEYAIPFAQKAGDSIMVANDYQNIALVLMNITDYPKAAEYYQKAIESLEPFNLANEEKLTTYVNAAKNAIYSRNFEKAKLYLDQARIQLTLIPHSLYAPVYYRTTGTFYRHEDKLDSAMVKLEKGLQLARAFKDTRTESAILFEKYLVYKKMGDFKAGKEMLLQAQEFILNMANLHDQRLHIRELAYTDSKLGNYREAFDWLDRYVILTDSAFEEDNEIKILELEKKYKTIEKENEILQLKGENQQQELELEENKFTIVLLLSVTLLGILTTFFGLTLYRSKKRTIKQNQLLHKQELKSLKQKEQLKVYNAMLQGQEQERNRIARDLHDGLGGMLSGVKLKLSSIVSKESYHLTQPDMEIYKVIHQLDQSVAELRRIARNMMPESLIYMGLQPALQDLCNYLNSDKTSITFEAYNLGDHHEQSLQISIYRIVQELLNNALKHAEARNILVQCSENENTLYITVEDDGKGFDPGQHDRSQGIGLSNIKNRVQLLQGTFEISSKLGEGTTCNIEVLLNEK